MDKNFISIDDLVRQRLEGGEEQERAGSWMRMRDLLDKEMEVKPVGFNWRRMFSAVAVLVLISAVGAGSYELSSFRNVTADNTIAANTNTATTLSATNNNNDKANNPSSNTQNKEKNNNEVNGTQLSSTANTTTTTVSNTQTATTNNTETATTHKKAHTSNSRVSTKSNDGPMLAANTATATVNKKTVSKKVTQTSTSNNTTATNATTDNATAKEATIVDSKPTNASATVPAAATPIATANTSNAVTADSKTVASVSNTTAGTTTTHKKSNSRHHSPAAGTTAMSALALSSSVPAVTNNNATPVNATSTPVTNATAIAHHKAAATRKHAVSSNTPAVTNIAPVSATSPIAIANNVPGANVQASVATTNKTNRKKAANTQRKTAPVSMPLAASTANNTLSNPIVTPKPRKGSRQIQQLMITQHFVKTSPTTGYFQLDTISQETITQEFELAESNAPDLSVFGPPPYDKQPEMGKSHTVVTINTRDNMKSKMTGTSTMENLSAAFNDVKNKVTGVHFAPGLTAGVNGTFFGPNSFKGFQFGGTGTFTFSDNFSIMGELKYVHRINGDYSLADNYYSYTPVATGGYTRELVQNPYSFSTLHSFELPISVRYCEGNFNFFVGANLVYTFAINTGAYPMADPTTATQVSTVGTDNAPKLKADDFGATFGLGYLFGASYQVAPNVMIDLRNVQTFWNTANSSGAKIISNQLYKSPSIQLSIGYRLGGNKNKQ